MTVQVTVENVGPRVMFVPPRNAKTPLEATVQDREPDHAHRDGRPYPQLAPGASRHQAVEVVARNRGTLPDAGGLRVSVVVTVNGDSKVPEVTLDNNGEYVKAVFPALLSAPAPIAAGPRAQAAGARAGGGGRFASRKKTEPRSARRASTVKPRP